MSQSAKTLTLMIAFIMLFAPASFADANHHGDAAGADTAKSQFKDQSDMAEMGSKAEMGGDHMQMMQSIMTMHMSMMGQVHDRSSTQAQVAQLFADGASSSDIMSRFDVNGDGAIDLEEFETWDRQAQRPSIVDRYQMLDADGVNAVTADEIEAAIKADVSGKNSDHMMGESKLK
ncbi:hypothetical protein [Cognatishimia activa]|uniref:hypothetical protein n=1 Tax=Cognatishimia activa TaxID=1715691 RepID=UPI0022314E95|nr:hypothetical protein [Cognatishimia activa]UZD90847.1 hypothetical protein M0D42_14890 [Cognatishimia activa]